MIDQVTEITVKYQNLRLGIIEREKLVQYKPDAHMADVVRFLKSSIPKVKLDKLIKNFFWDFLLFSKNCKFFDFFKIFFLRVIPLSTPI